MPQAKRGQSEAPVAARAQLDTLEADQGQTDPRERLEEQVKEQEATQKEELSRDTPESAKQLGELADVGPATQRAGVKEAKVQGGFMDQLSRTHGNAAIEGHYVTIDREHDGVKEAYKAAQLFDEDVAKDDDDPGDGFLAGFFGVYITRTAMDPDTGAASEVLVKLRDSSHAVVAVPYEALRRAEPAGRA